MTVNRDNQKFDTYYALPDDEGGFTVAPDGVGRYYYDSYDEAADDVGLPLSIVHLATAPED